MAVAANKASIESIAGRIHTPESFGRTIIASILKNAAKNGSTVDEKGNISVPAGKFTIKKIEQFVNQDPMTVELCWEDEAAQQSICIYV
ncbi:hypothetical protein [Streptomyces nojiriensis]|uniref:hypothetical protein n=1 Tax=Streptomyces nojiriensis TaxID=66374 RepID=UPI003651483A